MLRPITQSPNAPAPIPPQNYQASPLTIRQVIKSSYLVQAGLENYRLNGDLAWIEHSDLASLNGRVNFINQVTSHILENVPSRDTPITLISLGAGSLLTESFINNQLKNSGYKDLNWRIIDVDYKNDGCSNARKEFEKRVNNNVMAFTTEQEYLHAPGGNSKLAENDKNRGTSIVLSIDPPSTLENPSAKLKDPSCLLIKARPVEHIKEANTIYLLATKTADKEMLNQALLALSEKKFVVLDNVLQCSLTQQGNYQFSFSESHKGTSLYFGFIPYLDALREIASSTKKEIELNNIDKALDKYLNGLSKNGLCGIKFYASDYDSSLVKLHDYFANSNNQTLFASFEKNEISFEKKDNLPMLP